MPGPKDKTQGPQHWSQGKWRGKPRYQCSDCQFDTTSKPQVKQHVELVHGKAVTADD